VTETVTVAETESVTVSETESESETETVSVTVAVSETVTGFPWTRRSSRTPDAGYRTADTGQRNPDAGFAPRRSGFVFVRQWASWSVASEDARIVALSGPYRVKAKGRFAASPSGEP
jgi:hypothetical protein